jgi:hypothetical protein
MRAGIDLRAAMAGRRGLLEQLERLGVVARHSFAPSA